MEILQRYKPCFYFHPDESFFPLSVERFVDTSSVYWKGAIVANKITIPNLERFQEDTHLESTEIHGKYSNEVPVYGKIDFFPSFIELKYIILFAMNGPIGCCACFGAGEHSGDIEHITIRLDIVTLEVLEVYFSAHSGGQWVSPSDLDYHYPSQIVVYVAKNSHALYSKPGMKPRLFFFGNDQVQKGLLWDPNVVEINVDTNWVLYKGKWGTVSPLNRKGWFNNVEDDQNDTFWSRLCFFWQW